MLILPSLLLASLPFHVEVRHVAPAEAAAAGRVPGVASPESGRLAPTPEVEAVWTSPTIRAGAPFRDVLPSWNVDAPAGSGFVVELRVEPTEGGGFGPWLHVGDWGDPRLAPPLAARTVACEGGRVDVDVFLGARTFTAAELRVRAFTREPGLEVRVRRVTLCLRDREQAVEAPSLPAKRPLGTVLGVPLRSQRTEEPAIASRICSPTSIAMVLAFRGVDAPTGEIAARAHDPIHDLYGVWPRNVQTAWSYGVPGHVACFADWAAVERAILDGTPLVASLAAQVGELAGAPYASTPGHLIVLVGFDERGDCVVNDPASPDPRAARRVYARAEMETVWMRRGGVAYVLEARP